MSKFGKGKKRNKKVKTEIRDQVRGKGGSLGSRLAHGKITKAYLIDTESGAVMFKIEVDVGGRNMKWDECIQSGDKKGNSRYYEKNGELFELPGFEASKEVVVAALGAEEAAFEEDGEVDVGSLFAMHSEGEIEEGKVKVYDWAKKKDMPIKAQILKPLVGKKVLVGIHSAFVDVPKEVDGKKQYENGEPVPSGKCKRITYINKFFNAKTKQNFNEAVNDSKASFYKTWESACKDIIYDNTQNKIAPLKDGKLIESGSASSEGTGGGKKKSVKSLFDKKKKKGKKKK